MARPGPLPKPARLRVLAGNPGRRAIRGDLPDPATEVPECPQVLDGDEVAREEWFRVAGQLRIMGLISCLDRAALTLYCTAWSTFVEARAHVRKHGVVVQSPNGYPIQNPYLAIANKAWKQIHDSLQEFGLSPAARMRVKAGKPTANGSVADMLD